MVYTVKRIGFGSALRIGLLLGWLIALVPSLLLAGTAVAGLRQANSLLLHVTPVDIQLLGQSIARFDALELLGVGGAAQLVGQLAAHGWLIFAGLTAGLTLVGATLFVILSGLFALSYNLLAGTFGGLKLELREPPLA